MKKELRVLITSFSLILLSTGLALGQPAGEEDGRHLDRNFAVNLVVEPTNDAEGVTIITAKRRFLVQVEVARSEKRVELMFEGEITPRGHRLIIDEKRLDNGEMFLISYRIQTRPADMPKESGFSFILEGSAFLEENKQVLIGKTKDMVLKLRISKFELE